MKRLTIQEFPRTDILWNKVNEIIDYINKKENNNPGRYMQLKISKLEKSFSMHVVERIKTKKQQLANV